MKPEFKKIPFADYLATKAASASTLKTILNQSPLHAITPKEQTPAMAFGSAFHCAVLEPERFKNDYAIAPECDRRTKAGKAIYAAFQAASEGKTVIKQEDADLINRMRDAVMRNETAALLLDNGTPEISGLWIDQAEGVPCKMQADWLHNNRMIIDLKTTTDASQGAFSRASANFGYHVQAALYLDGATAITGDLHEDFYFIAIEKTEPFGCAVYQADYEMIEVGREKYRAALAIYANCYRSGVFPGYPEAMKISLPGWALNN